MTGPYTWVRALLPDGIGSYDMSVFQVGHLPFVARIVKVHCMAKGVYAWLDISKFQCISLRPAFGRKDGRWQHACAVPFLGTFMAHFECYAKTLSDVSHIGPP